VQIAHQIQTAILPVSPAVRASSGARMKPADDVAAISTTSSLREDLLVLIATSPATASTPAHHDDVPGGRLRRDRGRPFCSPRDVITTVNRVVHENVQRRMRRDDY